MKGIYYKIPIDFEGLSRKNDIEKISLETSLRQHFFLLATTALGECKFDETYGSEIWEMDFDLLKSDNSLKELIANTLKKTIVKHEKRLELESIEVYVNDHNFGNSDKIRMKKKVSFAIKGLIAETNRPFVYSSSFFVGPLSY
ncbi:lysozyme [Chryseobacterium shandongense]|uniref:Lysozyme n=1 Tax=Chryseobacterium shandongense TaxID=1493872 RepID=A0AAD0YFB2_9FLAO|nr:GPW/gp25 family protein [Chryseobacterium shandongense]AZA87463.1 lysozyme [Chryseobacterium shandongense]AZA95964.1 lysozyme [Chryseobacterium shandongense]